MEPRLPPSPAGPASEEDALLCPACGYDLRGTVSDRCSECGLFIDRALLSVSGFPWAHRRQIGRVRAYLQTVWLVTLGSRRLAYETSRPQDLRDARRFRWITAGIVAVVFLGIFAAAMFAGEGLASLAVQPDSPMLLVRTMPGWMQDLAVPWSAGATIPGILPAGLLALAIYLTGAQRWLFRVAEASPKRQERLEAVALYAAGPMVWLLPGVALVGAVGLLQISRILPGASLIGLWILAGLTVAVAVIGPPVRAVQWTVRAMHGGFGRAAVGLAQLLGLWLLGLVVWLGLLPWCIGFCWIVIDSFR